MGWSSFIPSSVSQFFGSKFWIGTGKHLRQGIAIDFLVCLVFGLTFKSSLNMVLLLFRFLVGMTHH